MHQRLKIKVCGMCHQDNINVIGQLPIDYMGFIFYDKSPRVVKRRLDLSALDHIEKVGVFVNEEEEQMVAFCTQMGLGMIQLHGEETPDQCASMRAKGFKVLKAINVSSKEDVLNASKYEGAVDYFLFDTKGQSRGGTGHSFDWQVLNDYPFETEFFLSGGIRPGSVLKLRKIDFPKLHAIDINSRFEVRPGVKSELSLKSFIDELRS